ncbi:putative ABC transport system ATP-binding protein [Rhodoligotrophos appendicifer]|uniref:ABC transporter ATP-binding protein n=1 Tax=Rhodoligotrophos appendicifer TaxID=987056 RepID=UPI001FEBEE04|nr:ABC transporter ATP-binding protein [Rhodoligotrophos appendicifer]
MSSGFKTGQTVVEVRGVQKIYKSGEAQVIALSDMSLGLRAGELTGIMGPSGSGKTTFLMIAGLLEPPSHGDVLFGGKIVAHPKTKPNTLREFRRNHIGFVFQKANLIPFLTATENVQIALEINDHRRNSREKAHHLLGMLGVGHRRDNYPSQLSGGEQQRVSIARALANEPILLLADEPTAALDGRLGRLVMTQFRELADERQVAVCVITHDPRWTDLFDSVVEMSDGRIDAWMHPRGLQHGRTHFALPRPPLRNTK